MNFPFVVEPELTDDQLERFRIHIDSDASGWHRRFTESIWRRHQHPSNARLSGWQGDGDRKRRLIHFYDEYGLEGRAFVLRNAYLALNLTLPPEHIDEYEAAIAEGIRCGGWKPVGEALGQRVYRRGALEASVTARSVHPFDEQRNYLPPACYRNLDVVVKNADYLPPPGWADRPWRVFFDVGLRKTLARGKPKLIEPEQLAEHFPAQVELGCGPSIEAGIPHLSTLHRIYGVSHADYGFVFRAADDGLLQLFADPEAKYREMTRIYGACATAGSTAFYETMRALHAKGRLVGTIITNNFDCQCAVLGLPEMSLRRYDWAPYYPTIDYDPRARSLLVIGVHADRRLVQMRARERGLKVVYVDPEQYVAPDGRVISYPVEAPQDEDFFVRLTAHEAFERLKHALPDLGTARTSSSQRRGLHRLSLGHRAERTRRTD